MAAKKDVRHVIRIDDENLWQRIQDRAYLERVPTTEIARRAFWAYLADPSIALELIRNNPHAVPLSKRSLQRRFAHMATKYLFEQEQAALKKRQRSKVAVAGSVEPPAAVVPDPFGLGF